MRTLTPRHMTQVPALLSMTSVAAIMNRRSSLSVALAVSFLFRCSFASARLMMLTYWRTGK